MDRNSLLECKIENGVLTMQIGVDVIAHERNGTMSVLDERDEQIWSYWERMPTVEEARKHLSNHMGVPALKPLKRPCHDCAITCGFYAPVAATLSLLTAEEIEERSLQWFCHNHPNRACAGNIAYQKRIAAERDLTKKEAGK